MRFSEKIFAGCQDEFKVIIRENAIDSFRNNRSSISNITKDSSSDLMLKKIIKELRQQVPRLCS